MKKIIIDNITLDNHIGCFGKFNIEDPVCKHLCALRLRCSTEYEQNHRMELFEELVSTDTLFMKMQ